MPDDELSLEAVRRMAADIGLTRLTEAHLQQLLRATQAARARRNSLAFSSLSPADEPAHVYVAGTGSASATNAPGGRP